MVTPLPPKSVRGALTEVRRVRERLPDVRVSDQHTKASRRECARHEAGHVVVASALNYYVHMACVFRTSEAPEGFTLATKMDNNTMDWAIVSMAGAIAQGVDYYSASDLMGVLSHADAHGLDPMIVIKQASDSARRMIDAHLRAVDALTEALDATSPRHGPAIYEVLRRVEPDALWRDEPEKEEEDFARGLLQKLETLHEYVDFDVQW